MSGRGARRKRALAFGGLVVVAALAAAAALVVPRLLSHGTPTPHVSSPSAAPAAGAAASFGELRLPASPAPAFTPRRPTLLEAPTRGARWAPVLRPTVARRAPARDAPAVARLSTRTPEQTANLVVVTREEARSGALWARVQLPILPNGTTGWVPRSALGGFVFVPTRLVVDRRRLVATLFRGGRVVFRAPVGVGQARWPTPAGDFYVRERLTSFRDPFYGPVAFGTSARSAVLTDWPGGGFVGIHGTNRPELIPGRVSHGCIRLRNRDILRLDRILPVGTPVTIR